MSLVLRRISFVFFTVVLILFSCFTFSSAQQDAECIDCLGCTSFLVGKDASLDGSTMTVHPCDCGTCDFTFRTVPAADHEPGDTRKIYAISQYETWDPEVGLKWDVVLEEKFTGVEIPQPPHTYAYIHGMFGYINEHQLAMGESTVGCHREMQSPNAVMNLTELTRIAMERCKTAREAIQLMGELGEKYGYGLDGGEQLSIADPYEAWHFEIMPVGPLWTPDSGKPGAIWCAQRIPDDHISVTPNESRIGEIDLENTEYFMASSNVVSYAVDNGYYDPESGEPFSWKKAYSPWGKSYINPRTWGAYHFLAPSLNLDPMTPNDELPFSIKPDKKVSVKDIMEVSRYHYEGTIFDMTEGLAAGPFGNPNRWRPLNWEVDGERYSWVRPIGTQQAEYVTITQSRSWLPDPIGGIVWIGLGTTDTTCFIPFYAGINEIPYSFQIGDHWTFNRDAARWAFDYADFHTQVKYSYAIKDVKEAQYEYEDGAIAEIPKIDMEAYDLYKEDPEKAKEFLTDYCTQNAEKVINAWWDLGDKLLVKYNIGFVYTSEDRQRKQVGYPEWWLKAVVEYDNRQTVEEFYNIEK
ncbi:MAG: C69 family dipeptidase [Atribacterota bacterium]|nr:C69 family dipeptidase [Atribacterota bacterium]